MAKNPKDVVVEEIPFKTWFAQALGALIGAKNPPVDIGAMLTAMLAQLPDYLRKHKGELTRVSLFKGLDALYWDGRENRVRRHLLEDSVVAGFSAQKLHAELAGDPPADGLIPPLWVVEERFLRESRGRVSAPRHSTQATRGILQLSFEDAPAYSLKRTSYAEPFHALSEHKGGPIKLAVMSAIQLGLPYDEKNIVHNLTRSAFSAARKSGHDAIVILGGMLRIDWQKTTGPHRLLRDLVTATRPDLKSLAENYQEEARAIMEANPAEEPLFVTAAERFEEPLAGFYKVTNRPEGPEFGGPVYIVLSPIDLALARQIFHAYVRPKQFRRFLEAQAIARMKATRLAHADEQLVEALQSGKSIARAQKDYNEAKKVADDAADLMSRFMMTNLESTQNVAIYHRVLSYFCKRLEESIPGAKVIDQQEACVMFGKDKRIIQFVSGGDTPNPYYEKLSNYGPKQRKGTLPALTVVGHPRSVGMRKIVRENYREGTMMVQPVGFVEAPILVDIKQILTAAEGNHIPLPVMKALGDPVFEAGMLSITIDPDLGITPNFLSAEALRQIGAPRRGRPAQPVKRFWKMVSTDMHFGGQNRLYVHRPSGVPVGLTEAALELMTPYLKSHHGLAPVGSFVACDDQTQGNHFDVHNQPHPNRLSNARTLDYISTRLAEIARMRNPAARDKANRELAAWQAEQIRVRTPDHLGSQLIELHEGLLIPHCDVFKGIILKAHASDVTIRTMSNITGKYDKRDIGFIMWGSGNHAFKTANGAIYEGEVVRDFLRDLLRRDPDLRRLGLDVEKCITAPLAQGTTMGYGRLRVGDGYEWGIEFTGTPPKRISWNDTLSGYVLADHQRGNPSTILEKCHVVHMTGDKHFQCAVMVKDNTYVMGAPDTNTDAFANIAGGLPENSAGKAFIGLPVDGPDSGEISVVHLTPKLIQEYLLSGKVFPWEDFLTDSI